MTLVGLLRRGYALLPAKCGATVIVCFALFLVPAPAVAQECPATTLDITYIGPDVNGDGEFRITYDFGDYLGGVPTINFYENGVYQDRYQSFPTMPSGTIVRPHGFRCKPSGSYTYKVEGRRCDSTPLAEKSTAVAIDNTPSLSADYVYNPLTNIGVIRVTRRPIYSLFAPFVTVRVDGAILASQNQFELTYDYLVERCNISEGGHTFEVTLSECPDIPVAPATGSYTVSTKPNISVSGGLPSSANQSTNDVTVSYFFPPDATTREVRVFLEDNQNFSFNCAVDPSGTGSCTYAVAGEYRLIRATAQSCRTSDMDYTVIDGSCPIPTNSQSSVPAGAPTQLSNSSTTGAGCTECFSDPVRASTGNSRHSDFDPLPIPSFGFLRVNDSRIYVGAGAYGSFGKDWRSLFDSRLSQFHDGELVRVRTESLDDIYFRRINGSYVQTNPVTPTPNVLTLAGGVFSFRANATPFTRQFRASDGRLIRYLWDELGREILVTYSGDQPISVEDTLTGQVLAVTSNYFSGSYRITKLQVSGRPETAVNYEYDQYGILRRVALADNSTYRRYEVGNHDALGAVYDGADQLITNHTYDSRKRATSALDGNGDSTVQYLTSTTPGEAITRVTYANGSLADYHIRSIAGEFRTVMINGPCDCGTRFALFAYDSAGRRVREQNERGFIDTFAYDPVSGALTSSMTNTKPMGCDPATDTTQCRLTADTLPTALIEPTTASVTTSYLYGDSKWKNKPTEISVSSMLAAGQTRRETFVYDFATGETIDHAVIGWTGVAARQETRRTLTTLYDGVATAAFTPGGTLDPTWWSLPQPKGARRRVDGARANVQDIVDFVYFPIHSSVTPGTLRGRLAATRNALGHETRYEEYDDLGNATKLVDSNGVVTVNTYDRLSRMLTSTTKAVTGCDTVADPLCATDLATTRTYTGSGPLATEVSANGAVTKYEYDGRGRMNALERGPATTDMRERLEYDIHASTGQKRAERARAKENGVWVTKRTTSYSYDGLDRLVTTTHADGTTVTNAYDPGGNLASVKDENHTDPNTLYSYDSADQLTLVKQKLNAGFVQTGYGYDRDGNLASVTDPNGNVTTYLFDDFGQMLRQTSPVSGVTTYEYDLAGNLTTTTDARGAVMGRTYDALGRVTSLITTLATQTETVTWAYDETAAGPFSKGRLTTMTDSSGSTAYAYERRGLLRRERKVIAGTTYETLYRYDAHGNRSGVTMPAKDVLTYGFDFAGRPLSLNRGSAPIVSAATYLPFGPLKSLTYGNLLTRTNTYDERYRMRTNRLSAATDLVSYSYGYDNSGNITSITDVLNAAYNRTFSYDDLHRLTVANSGASLWGSGSYTYDAMGNVRTLGLGASRNATFNYSGTTPKLASAVENGTSRAVTYDVVGNETTVGADTFAYTVRNSLSSGNTITYAYDGRGVRVSTTRPAKRNTTTRHYLYTPELNLLAETAEAAASPALAHQYLWFAGTPIAQVNVSANTVTYTFTDHLGTPLALTDAGGAIVWRAEHDPYGRIFTLRSGSGRHQPLRFPGQEAEQLDDTQVNGLTERSYNIFRWYRGAWGRYSQRDPLGLSAGVNLYIYALNRPLTLVDPRGLICGVTVWTEGASVDLSAGWQRGFMGRWGHQWIEWQGGSAGFWPGTRTPETPFEYVPGRVQSPDPHGGDRGNEFRRQETFSFIGRQCPDCSQVPSCLAQFARTYSSDYCLTSNNCRDFVSAALSACGLTTETRLQQFEQLNP